MSGEGLSNPHSMCFSFGSTSLAVRPRTASPPGFSFLLRRWRILSETRCSSGLFWLSFWPPSVEALGREGPVPASISPPVGLRTWLGMGVLSNGVLNEHPSFSGNSCALRANQLECLRMVERRQVLEGWGFSKPGRVHSLAPWFLMSWVGRQDPRVSQFKFY